MTTEVGSETEVKKEPEKAESQQEQPAATAPKAEPANEAKPEAQPAASEPPAAAAAEAAAAEPAAAASDTPAAEEQQQTSEGEQAQAEEPKAEEEKKEKKEKDKEGKGISRFLPPWLKRSKSQSQVGPKESAPKEGSVEAVKEEEDKEKKEDEGKPAAAAEAAAEEDKVDGEQKAATADQSQAATEEVPSAQEPKADDKEEKHSIGSADTQPAKEEKGEESQEKDAEETKAENGVEEEAGEEPKKEEEPTDKADTSILSPLRLTKKIKMVVCQVTMLDGSQFTCEAEKRAKGQFLVFKVCEQLNLLEKDYFGLCFKDNADQKCWLDPLKEIKRQIRNGPWNFSFNVKFYPPDPSQLTEDITRYLLCLQLRQDIASGRLPCSFVTHALLGSYTLQAELGDHDPDEHRTDYTSDFQFAPNQTREMEEKVVELHKSHRGMTPAQADSQFLENAKKLSMFGVDLHHAKDSEGVDIMLGVCANGLLIYKDRLRINRFAWPKILKISYKRSNFYIKIRPGETEQFESTVGFKLPNHRAAKKLWKVCVENHTFFRLMTPEQPTKAKFLTLGSKFRYSGRTQAQTRQASSLIDRPAPYFQRTSSKRISRSLDGAPVISVTSDGSGPLGEKENGRDPALELSSDSKDEDEMLSDGAAAATTAATFDSAEEDAEESEVILRKSKLRVQGENIYVRHSNLMLEDLDKTQDDVLKHQASISELKRSFMEATPEPRPSQWDKRLTASPVTSLRLQAQGKSPPRMETFLPESKDVAKSADDKQKSEAVAAATTAATQPVVEIEETVIVEEVRKTPKPATSAVPEVQAAPAPATQAVGVTVKEEKPAKEASASSDSESEEEAEYHPQVTSVSVEQIKEEPEEEEQEEAELNKQQQHHQPEPSSEPQPEPIAEAEAEPEPAPAPAQPVVVEDGTNDAKEDAQPPAEVAEDDGIVEEEMMITPDEAPNGYSAAEAQGLGSLEEEEQEPRVNGDALHVDTDHLPQVICCSEPPVVKTEMVTISDTFAAQKTEIATKEVPIVHTETKTITYEAAQLDGSGDGEPGVLMTAQTITSESLCTTTTTHITKTLKGGLSETRIEKRIVITGDSDIDHDQALAQAIKEAKEQHPDMSVTRVVVHKETELAEDED
ncbi:band 4.1-like protein 2 isoform X2 [Sardina pilchardus]|uniref:band 4.1-like protein 2 isoform X2 n=1 Tax=Sardina pilchardus TaxID=27697 RepID=UPI002E0FFE56